METQGQIPTVLNRPVHEVLFPALRDISYDYTTNFQGMTIKPVPLESLLTTRQRVVTELQQGLDENERRFLLSLVSGVVEWSLLDIAHLEQLPGIRWKLQNLTQLDKKNPKKFAEQVDELAERLASVASVVVASDASRPDRAPTR